MKAVLLGARMRKGARLSLGQAGCNPPLLHRIMKVAIGCFAMTAARQRPGHQFPGVCSLPEKAAAVPSV